MPARSMFNGAAANALRAAPSNACAAVCASGVRRLSPVPKNRLENPLLNLNCP
ncbi:hypothetical protein GGD41_005885 [Paraburkholderia bryophila]|uniref:Uncharacterized protein n=1 Tax=Paraburkholderia bryophila TaxID=420952 RepID=A0A7Y9WD50_9BURK|nr:hypothetical protein [Paraburkholderia bryophila]